MATGRTRGWNCRGGTWRNQLTGEDVLEARPLLSELLRKFPVALPGAKGRGLMHTFKVWAPLPKKVEVQVKGKNPAPDRAGQRLVDGGGRPSGAGDDYGFILDDEGPFPDPRSAWPPHGVHGLSRLVEHGAHVWTDAGWQGPRHAVFGRWSMNCTSGPSRPGARARGRHRTAGSSGESGRDARGTDACQ